MMEGWIICKLSWWSVDWNPFKLRITEQGWASCMIHDPHPGGDGGSQIFVTQPQEGLEPFWIGFAEGQMLLSRNCCVSLCLLSLESLQENNFLLWIVQMECLGG